ncbi:nucleosome assembly protein [Monosporozyma unispora]|nr:hypothetical protein C6P44_004271 [Kazachstania unispora]
MTSPIKTTGKPKSSMKIDNAPTPHNTPASVLNNSYLKNGNPTKNANKPIPTTISEEDLQSALENVNLEGDGDGAAAAVQASGNPLANNPAISGLLYQSIQDKLGDLIGTDSGYLDNLPESVKGRVLGLKALQVDLYDLEKKFQIEMFELENKYLNLYKPLFQTRSDFINGSKEPTKEQIEIGEENEDKFELEEGEKHEADADVKGIPSFWLTALENLPIVNETITDRDAEVLAHLQDISMEYLTEGKPGFKLIFKFNTKENEFFKNEILVKTYYYQSELGYSGDFIYDHAEGDAINWVDNASNVTVEVEMRKQRNKSTKQVRTIEKLTPIESFFNFFDPPKMHICGDEHEHDHDHDHDHEHGEGDEYDEDEEGEDLEARLALDYSIGEQLKDKLIPRAVDWFTGTALEFEYDEEEEEEEFDDEDGEDFDEEEEEQDDFAGATEGVQGQDAPECKQS